MKRRMLPTALSDLAMTQPDTNVFAVRSVQPGKAVNKVREAAAAAAAAAAAVVAAGTAAAAAETAATVLVADEAAVAASQDSMDLHELAAATAV